MWGTKCPAGHCKMHLQWNGVFSRLKPAASILDFRSDSSTGIYGTGHDEGTVERRRGRWRETGAKIVVCRTIFFYTPRRRRRCSDITSSTREKNMRLCHTVIIIERAVRSPVRPPLELLVYIIHHVIFVYIYIYFTCAANNLVAGELTVSRTRSFNACI